MTKLQIPDYYKCCFLDANGLPSNYILFVSERRKNDSISSFFSNVEWNYILEKQIEQNISLSRNFQLYPDDSILSVKKKINRILHPENQETDLYLFSCVKQPFRPLSIYKRMSQLDSKPITKPKLNQLLMNYYGVSENIDAILQGPFYQDKSVFSYEDLLEIDWFYGEDVSEDTIPTKIKKIPIGMRFVEIPHDVEDTRVNNNQDVFCSNPFDILFPYIYRPSKDVVLQTFDNDFLFHYCGEESSFVENTIYVCTLEVVQEFLNKQKINKRVSDEILATYFPEKQITVLPKQIETSFWEQEKNMQVIYSLMEQTDNAKPFLQGTISSFKFILHPENPIQLPLETIFKNIHTSLEIPLIQYSPEFIPGLMREKIYRFYYEKESQNGNKIPYLSPELFFSWTKKNEKMENITLFVVIPNSDDYLKVILESNGNIMIETELEIGILPEVLDEWISHMIYPAIYQINTFTKSAGFSIRPFSSLQAESVEIIFLHYRGKVEVKKNVSFDKIMQLFSPLFYNELSDKKNKDSNLISKRYKRVEYFQTMNKYEEYISEMLRETQDDRMLMTELEKKFSTEISLSEAKEILDKYQEKYKNIAIPSHLVNKRIELLQNTGFSCKFQKADFENEWIVNIENITSMKYVFLLDAYLNVFFHLSQYSTNALNSLFLEFDIKKRISTPMNIIQRKPQNNVPTTNLPIFVSEPIRTVIDSDSGKKIEVNESFSEEKEKEQEQEIVEEEGEEYEIPEEYESEYESESESESDEEEEGEERKKKKKGGVSKKKPKTTNKKKKIDEDDDDEDDDDDEADVPGKKSTKLNTYFMKRVKKRFPLLTKNGFTRICAANEKRQPIILTNQEKQKIDKEYKGLEKPYSHSLQYGVDADKEPFHYICPTYWCVKPGEEGPLTKEEVDQKKCGEIIQDPKNIKSGEYTYEWREGFTEPGFVNRKKEKVFDPKTGKEICFPCCFQNWSGKAQFERRNQCNAEQYPLHLKKQKAQEKRIIQPPSTRNILDITYIPLPSNRIGILPIAIQLFLNENTSAVCIDSQNLPKLNCPLMVRYGVVQAKYENNYFLACLADIYSYQRNEVKAKSIPEMREILCSAISLDIFITLQNASLVSLFRYSKDGFIVDETARNFDVLQYQDTDFFQRLDANSETHMDFFESTIQSYEHFLQYLRDPETVIDPTYLWEAITQKNPLLLPRGINMAILEITDTDITNNVELICPSCVYGTLYDPAKETWILMKKGPVYEPIYLYEITSLNPEKITYQKTFRQNSQKNEIVVILKMIQSWILDSCGPISRKPRGYMFEKNISAREVLTELKKVKEMDFSIKSAVLNYQNKIIGWIVTIPPLLLKSTTPSIQNISSKKNTNTKTKRKTDIFLPTFPSAIIPKLPSKWMDEPDLWNDYDTTVSVLKEIYRLSNQKILSKPIYRIIEDEKIVGILTMTNQFVQIDPFEDNRDFQDDLITLEDRNPIPAEKKIVISKPIENRILSPKERIIRNIQLETQFYNAFRNTIRILLNLYKNRKIREQIRNAITEKEKMYSDKMKEVESNLREISIDAFSFQEYSEKVLSKIQDVFICQSSGTDTCGSTEYCLLVEKENSQECQLILPINHLIHDTSNENNYYLRLSDELVRHKRVRMFMMYPDTYLQINSGEYKIYDNEFVIPRSILTPEYFQSLKRFPNEKYVDKSVFETANPTSGIPPNPTQLWSESYRNHK